MVHTTPTSRTSRDLTACPSGAGVEPGERVFRSTAPGPLRRWQAWDAARPGIPGEHWVVLAAGIAAWALTRKSPSLLVRTAGVMAGTALVGRAASGRDGLAKLMRLTPVGGGIR